MSMLGSRRAGSFVDRHGLWTDEQWALAERNRARLAESDIDLVRLSFADQHGVLRGKTVSADAVDGFLLDGCGVASTLLLKDTSHRTVFPVWTQGGEAVEGLRGASDVLMLPDPASFRVLPWSPRTAWFLCDLFHQNGEPVTLSSRFQAQRSLRSLAAEGYDYVAGLEIEFHLFRLTDPHLAAIDAGQPGMPPDVAHSVQGYQFLSEERFDRIEPILDVLYRTCRELGLPVRTLELEFGPSQVELTLQPQIGLAMADSATLLRSAVKQVSRRHGYHATFMCRPQLADLCSSGWHLHQSLRSVATGKPVFTPPDDRQPLSPVGTAFVAGLLDHAAASCLLTTPTLNGYKRYRPYSLAPDRILWGRDNRAAMLRVISAPGNDSSRVENRVGEPAANPYLYLASQVLSGLDGIRRQAVPTLPADAPYETDAPRLPTSLIAALDNFRASSFYRTALGEDFVSYLARLKQAEVERFLSTVTDWEHREYFDLF